MPVYYLLQNTKDIIFRDDLDRTFIIIFDWGFNFCMYSKLFIDVSVGNNKILLIMLSIYDS